MPCKGQDYREVPRDCNSYLHCDGSVWRQQNCAPGLHWSQADKHCDWPKYAKCKGNTTFTENLFVFVHLPFSNIPLEIKHTRVNKKGATRRRRYILFLQVL